jgi:hypothetical protein
MLGWHYFGSAGSRDLLVLLAEPFFLGGATVVEKGDEKLGWWRRIPLSHLRQICRVYPQQISKRRQPYLVSLRRQPPQPFGTMLSHETGSSQREPPSNEFSTCCGIIPTECSWVRDGSITLERSKESCACALNIPSKNNNSIEESRQIVLRLILVVPPVRITIYPDFELYQLYCIIRTICFQIN